MFFRDKKKKPLRRYVYLMERVSKREWKTILTFKREIKIGVAKDSQQRKKTVDRGIPGRIVLLAEYKVDRATTVEARLHKKYKRCNFIPKNSLSGSGKSEFFRLSELQLLQIKLSLAKESGKNDLKYFVIYLIIGFVILYLINQ